MQQNKQLAHLFNFQKKKDLPQSKEDQIDKRCQEGNGGTIKLSWLKINASDIKYILASPTNRQSCEAASELYFEFNQLQPKGALELTHANWKNLRLINLASNRIGSRGVYYLTRGDWKLMESLGLMANQIMNEGLMHLQKGQWKNLTILILSSNNISDRGLKHLSLGDWQELAWIDLSLNRISEFGVNQMVSGHWNALSGLPFTIPRKKQKFKETFQKTLKNRFLLIQELQITFF